MGISIEMCWFDVDFANFCRISECISIRYVHMNFARALSICIRPNNATEQTNWASHTIYYGSAQKCPISSNDIHNKSESKKKRRNCHSFSMLTLFFLTLSWISKGPLGIYTYSFQTSWFFLLLGLFLSCLFAWRHKKCLPCYRPFFCTRFFSFMVILPHICQLLSKMHFQFH